MTLQLHRVLALNTPQILPSPAVRDLEPILLLRISLALGKFRDLTPHRGPRRSLALRVGHEDQGALFEGTRPVFGWMFGVKGLVGVVAPFIGVRWTTGFVVLVEGEENLVL